MVNLLGSLLGPIFEPMGVSQADLINYITMVQSYVWVILIALVAMIVVLIVAGKAKKGVKGLIRWNAVLAWLAITAIVVNLMCYGPLKTNVSGFLNASKVELSDETVAQSKAVIQKVGEEGVVLLENDGILPLAGVTKLNVFGWSSTNPILGGTGSGSSDGSTAVGILQSLQMAGFETNEDLTAMYKSYRADRPTIAMQNQDWTLPEPTVDAYTDDVMSQAKGFSDVAVIVISRSGGEGADLPTDMNAVIKGTWNIADKVSVTGAYGYTNGVYTNNGSYDDFEPGEHYLEPSVTEENMIAKVCSEFDKVVLIINANNAMELGWIADYPQIGAVLYAPGAGNTGLTAIGEILSGTVNPSGKTADTFVRDLTATPTWNNFGNFAYDNVTDFKKAVAEADTAYEGNMAFVNYVEGIYVGYKFYETAFADAMEGFDYDDAVVYPFGYGLSFTSFEKSIANFADNGDSVSFEVIVKNTGTVPGKDVAEIYFTPPYNNGGIEKAAVNLIDFAKTGVLEPGASETLSFTIAKEDFAAYDSGVKVSGGGYILEAGDYTVSLRSDAHTVIAEESFNVASDIKYTDGRSTDLAVPVNQFQDYSRGDYVRLSRADGFANYAEATAAPTDFAMSAEIRAVLEKYASGFYDPTEWDNASDVMPTLGAQNGLKLADLAGKSYDDPDWEKLLDQLSFEDMVTMINIGGWQTAKIDSVGKVATSDCDGPAGLSNFITGAYGTAYPAEVLMAQTWNTELIEEMGEAMGQEYEDANNFGWYGPAMNTHRNAFAGRNFEYYSEDGVLGGKLASAEINGACRKGVYPYIKHFALNDQETNRCSFLLTFADEQEIREIYLKPFEMCVKNYEGTPIAVMSSFNFIGTEPSTANPYLLNKVLRDEWGFVGMVETDYDGSYGYMISDHSVRAGNDLMLGFGYMPTDAFTDQSATATLAMRQACKNILYTVGNSGYYAGDAAKGGMDNMTKLFLGVDVGIGVLIVAIEAILLANYKKKKKAAAAA
ncbi:MAG: glycoside hydrolase family 3 C-terminal domain-containing protein [Oscillospiraceae bacterium]|nr:glycoside hydrolase family 3 C-terminal domain-containing protein [Oscillospiraceae bacterium]